MEKIEVTVISPTGSGVYNGILYPASGIIEYEKDQDGIEISHIASEISGGWKVIKKEEVAPKEEKTEVATPVIETPAPVVSPKRSDKNKSKNSKR